jgi:CheY-like chemotaxis protein
VAPYYAAAGLSAGVKRKVYGMKNTAEVSSEKAPMKKVLCVGNDMRMLSIRCEVLNRSGYSAQTSTLEDAADLIKKESFDLIIVSAFLSDANQQRVLSAAGDTPTLVLQGIAVAPELLAAVEANLSSTGPSN